MDTVSKGKILLEKLQQVVNQADINSKQATQGTSYGIEQTIEVLHGRKKKLEDAFKDRNKLLEQSVKSSQLDDQIKQYTAWLQSEGELFLTRTSTVFENSTEDAEQLLKRHQEFNILLKEKKEGIQKTIRDGQKLVNSNHFDSATIKYKIGKLDESRSTFSNKLEQQENILSQTVKFVRSSVPVTSSLDLIKVKLQSRLLDVEKQKLRKDATEVSSSILREGQILTSKSKSKKVADIFKSIKDKYNHILLSTERNINSDDDDVVVVSREIDRISNWIVNVAEDFVNLRKSIGSNKIHAGEFEKDHQDMFDDLNRMMKQINEIRSKVTGFSKKKKKIVFDFMERLDSMLDRCSTIAARIKFRLLLVKMFNMFLKHSEDVLKKISLLEEELSSDEPHENVNATTSTLNRQKQEKEVIINAAEVLDEESKRILEDLSLCLEEKTLDRNGIKLKIGKDLKNIVMHTMQMEELWDQREKKLDHNKRLSTQFFEFEKEIRKVIGFIHNQSETVFPLNDGFPGLKSTQAELQERLVQLQNIAQFSNKEIEAHLTLAENFKTSPEKEYGVKAVTAQLNLIHQKFRTKLSKHEALLSMCSTFYASVEKLVGLMNTALQEYTSDYLPRDTVFAVQKLKENAGKFHNIEELSLYTVHNGHDVLQSIREYDSIDGKTGKIEEAFKHQSPENWKTIWEENQKKLDESLLLLKVLQDISQVTLVVEEQTRRLLNINSTFGNSLISAVTFCQESDAFQDEVKTTEHQIAHLRINISKLVQTGHPDAFKLEVKLNLVERRWGKLAELMESHKSLLNSAVEFYQLCDQVETWLKDSNQFVKTTRAGARRCTTEKEIRELIDLIDNFKFSGVDIQENRLQTLSGMSSLLNSEDARSRANQLSESQHRVNQRLEKLRADMENQISRIQSSDINVPLLWDDDDDTEEVIIPERRITLSTAAESPLLSDLSVHGDETMQWTDDVSENASGRPKLLVTVSSNNQVPADMQKRISPIVKAEMDEFSKKDVAKITVGTPTTFTFGFGKKSLAAAPGSVTSSSSDIPTDVGSSRKASLGPQVQKEIYVKTDYDIETSPPSPSHDDSGMMYTMKKTLVTTTKEVTTLTRQEIKTELEVVHVDSENELPRRMSASSRESDRVGVSITTAGGIGSMPGLPQDNATAGNTLSRELQGTNENICKGVESSLFAERQDALDDSYIAQKSSNKQTVQMQNTAPKQRYEIFAKDANNQGLKVRHIPKSSTYSTSVPIKSDDRPVSMLELTLNLDGIDLESEDTAAPSKNEAIKEEEVVEDILPQPELSHNVYAAMDDMVGGEEQAPKTDSTPVKVVVSLGSKPGQPAPKKDISLEQTASKTPIQVVLSMTSKEEEQSKKETEEKMREKLTDSEYTENLVNVIIKESVQEIDPHMFINKINEENAEYLDLLRCTIKNYMDKITVAPLKLQKNKDAIFRNTKDLLHFQKNVLIPAMSKCNSGDDIADFIINNYDKFSKLYHLYISKAADLDKILTNTSYFSECNAHKSHLKEHLDGPQRYINTIIVILQDINLQTVLLNRNTVKIQIALQLVQNIKNLNLRNVKEVTREIESNDKNLQPVQDEVIQPIQNGAVTHASPADRLLEEYDVISLEVSTSLDKVNGHPDVQTIVVPDFELLKKQPRYVISKGYMAKRKDEIFLPLGTEVTIIQKQRDRSYVVAFTKHYMELDRGWLPTYCLTLKEEAVEITSKEARPPSFNSQLVSTTIVEGNVAELSVKVNGFPKPEVTWYLDGLPVRNDINHRVVWEGDQVTLRIEPAVIDDEGIYTVKAVNALGSATCQAEFIVESDVSSMSGISDIEWEESKQSDSSVPKKIHVGDRITFRASFDATSPRGIAPSFVQNLRNKTVRLGSNVTFNIQADGDPQPYIAWFLNNRKLEESKDIKLDKERTVHSITFKNIIEKYMGTLKCVLTNSAGKDECSCVIAKDQLEDANNNLDIPSLVAESDHLQVLRDHDAKFVVAVSGKPEPEINWYKGEIHMTEEYGAEIHWTADKCTMVLKEVTRDDEGEYYCIARNKHGEVKCSFYLQIVTITTGEQGNRPPSLLITDEGPPVILEKFIDKQCYEGDVAKFQVKAKGVPKPNTSWFFNGQPLSQSKNIRLSQEGSNYILTILVCDKENSGHYTFVAENERGKVVVDDDITIHESNYPPKFLHHTKDVAVNANDTCTIGAVIKGKPKPDVEWYRDNRCLDERSGAQFINSDDIYSLVIQRFTEKHAGSYKCSAFNNAGESSCVIDVSLVKEKISPYFTEPASDTRAGIGGTAKLEVTITAYPLPKVTWYKDGEPLANDTKYSFVQTHESTFILYIRNTIAEDSGTYQCVAENAVGKQTCECQLIVSQPDQAPRFIKPLTDFTVLEHEMGVEMQVIVSGNPKPDVLFYKDGSILESSARRKLIRENDQHTLHWKYVLPDDAGRYSVIASNSEGEEESSCILIVAAEGKPPEILPHGSSMSVTEGEVVSMTIKATGIPTPEISWMKGKEPVQDNENVKVSNNVGESTLTIDGVSLKDAGDYQSVAQSSSGTSSATIRLNVKEGKKEFPPEFSSTLENVEVSVGNDAVLELGIVGYPAPKVQWKKNCSVLLESKNIEKSYQNGVYKLTLKNVQSSSAGCYECVALNELGEVSCQCMVNVRTDGKGKEIKRTESEKSKAPKFLQSLHDVHIHLSEPIVLETVVGGTPFPDIRWYKQDKLLHPSKRIKISSTSKDGRSFLRIFNSGKEDAGEYEIVAKNKHGETSMSCEVFVKDLIKVSRGDSKKESSRPEKPSITDRPEEPHVNEGDEIKFSFTVNGNPQPGVEMLKDGSPFKQPSHITTQLTDNVFTFFTNDCKTTDEAVYEFIASNSYGKDSFKLEILVDDTGELEVVAKTIGSDSRKQSKDEAVLQRTSSSENEELRARLSPKPPSKRLKKHKKIVPREKEYAGDESDTDGIVSEDVIKLVDEQVVEAVSAPALEFASEALPSGDVEPTFVDEPQNQKMMEGRPLRISCKVAGSPEPSVKWFKDGKQLEEGNGLTMESKNGQATLKINKCKKEDGGEYVCWIENKVNKTMLPVMVDIILLPSRPEWVTKLEDMTITEGEDAIFEVGVSGLPYPDIQWFQDNRLISQSERILIESDKEAKTHKLTIKKCSLREGRNLKCIARNTQGTATSMASLKVQEAVIAPQFITPLQDLDIMQTEDIKLKVAFSGKPKPLVQWSFNDQVIKSSQKIKIRNERENSQITIPNCKDEHTGQYKAVCSNVAGEATTECKVTVTEELREPEITSTPKNLKCVEGRSATLKVAFIGKPQPDVKWMFKGNEILPVDGIEIKKDTNKSSLVIKSCSLENSGIYTCDISNKSGTKTCFVELNVEESQSRPVISEKYKDVTVVEKDTVELSVTFKGKPKPTIYWSKNEIKLKQDTRFSFTEEEGKATLKLTGATTSDTGNYKVTIKNSQGETSHKAKVTVQEEVVLPTFSSSLNDSAIFEGEALVLSVKADGVPKPKLEWSKDGAALNPKFAKLRNNGEELRIEKCKMTDAGIYKCCATNKAGTEQVSCKIKINEPPKAPSFKQVPPKELSHFEDEFFLENFSVTGTPAPTLRVFKDGEPVSDNVNVDFNSLRSEGTIEISKVSIEDAGFYKVVASNEAGTDDFTFEFNVRGANDLVFVQKLTDITTMEDGNAILEVMFKGSVVDVDWYKDNEYIDESDKYEIVDEENRCTCVVHNCTVADAGTYRCEIQNENSSESCSAVVTVKEGVAMPAFLEPLKDESIEEGEKLLMEVISEGKPEPAVKWLRNGVQIVNGVNVRVHTDSRVHTLTIPSVSQKDSGFYVCRLSNSVGVVECKAKIEVTESASLPTITKPMEESMTFDEGSDAVLLFTFEGVKAKATFFKDDVEIRQDKRVSILLLGKNTIQLTIKYATEADSGIYSGRASNQNGVVSSDTKIIILPKPNAPKFQSRLMDTSVNEGDDLTLKVAVDGIPPPKVSFFKDSKKLTTGADCEITLEDNQVILRKPNATVEDSGVYTCEIKNDLGSMKCQANINIDRKPKPVELLVDLNDFSLKEGEDIVLQVEATGYPIPSFQWFKNGDPLKPVNVRTEKLSSVLTISKCSVTNAGNFKCVVSNSESSATTECNVVVKQQERAPEFKSELKDFTSYVDDVLCIELPVVGYPTPTIEWFKDGKSLDGDRDYVFENDFEEGIVKLLAQNPDEQFSGVYKAVVTNDLGENSTECEVNIKKKPQKPTFVEGFEKNVTVDEHTPVILTLTVVGIPPPEIQWLKDGQSFDAFESIINSDGNVETKLEITDPKPVDSGKYTCVGKNETGKNTISAIVTINEIIAPPKFESELKDYEGFEGNEVILSTECSGSLPQLQKWTKDGRQIHNTSSTRVNRPDNMDHKFMLKIPKAKVSDSGLYELEVTNAGGNCRQSCRMTIQGAPVLPHFVIKLKDQNNLTEGKHLECFTKISGKPLPDVHWFINDVELVNNEDVSILTKDDGKSTLVVKNLTLNQNGTLKCEAINQAGTVSSTCKMKIAESSIVPEFIQQLEDITVNEGEEVVLTVQLHGKPKPSVTWSKARTPLSESDNIQLVEDGNTYKLIIKRAAVDDMGRYKVTASNKAGERFSSAGVGVEQKQETPVFTKALPTTYHLVDGQMLVLEVEYSGSPKPRIRWKHNGRNLKFDKRFQIIDVSDNISRLEMVEFTIEDTGVYTCILTNDSGEETCDCNVDMQKEDLRPPEFITSFKDVSIDEGKNLVLEIVATGGPELDVNFYKDDMVLQNIDGIFIENTGDKWTVAIEEIEPEDSGRYICKLSNNAGEKACACQVEVNRLKSGEPKVVLKPIQQNTTVVCAKGKSVKFEARLTGDVLPLIEWGFGETLLDPSEKYEMVDGDDGYNSLTVHNVTSEDEGEYSCIADLKDEDDEEEIVFLLKIQRSIEEEAILPSVQKQEESYPDEEVIIQAEEEISLENAPEPPVVKKKPAPPPVAKKTKKPVKAPVDPVPSFTMKPKDKDASSGSQVRFTCNASGEPASDLQWFFDGVPLEDSAKYVVTFTAGASTLVITDISPNDIGEYKVVAKNDAGENEVVFFLSVDGQTERLQEGEKASSVLMKKPSESSEKDAIDGIPKGPVNVSIEFQGEPTSDDQVTASRPYQESKGKSGAPVQVSLMVDTKPDSKPSVVTPLDSQTVIEGDDVVLKAQFSGEPPLEYSWFKDEIALIESPRVNDYANGDWAFLEIKNVRVDDEAEYVCIAANEFGGCETAAELLVDEKDNPIQEELDQMGANELQQIDSEFSNKKPTKKKAPVPPPPAKKPKPQKPETKPKSKQIVEEDVVDSATVSQVECSAPEQISITKNLKDTETFVGDTLELSVETNSTTPLEALWVFNGEILMEEEGLEVINLPPVYTLKMTDVVVEDEGEYVVELRNDNSQLMTSSCMVLVNDEGDAGELPEIVADLDSVEVEPKESAEFRLLMHSDSPTNVEWFFNGKKIESSDKYDIGMETDEYFLIVNKCNEEDVGEYRVDITNSFGKVSSDALLDVILPPEEPPKIFPIPQCKGKMELTDGDDLKLEFDIESTSETLIKWLKNNKEIEESETVKIFSDDISAYLLINEASPKNTGSYIAIIENAAGKEKLTFDVVITGN